MFWQLDLNEIWKMVEQKATKLTKGRKSEETFGRSFVWGRVTTRTTATMGFEVGRTQVNSRELFSDDKTKDDRQKPMIYRVSSKSRELVRTFRSNAFHFLRINFLAA